MAIGIDPYLAISLTGVHLIEASAGTGKTFVLTTLVLRLIVERNLPVHKLLVVTYTEAATNELRRRIRDRCLLAVRLLSQKNLFDEQASAESSLTTYLLQAHLQRTNESPETVLIRLQHACAEMDLAGIYTIHGFCAKILRENMLDSALTSGTFTLLDDASYLYQKIAQDIWRALSNQADLASHLHRLWNQGPEALARDIPALLRASSILPSISLSVPSPHERIHLARRALTDAFNHFSSQFKADLLDAITTKNLHNTVYSKDWVDKTWPLLSNAFISAKDDELVSASLFKLTNSSLAQRTKKGRTSITCPFDQEIHLFLSALNDLNIWNDYYELECVRTVQLHAHQLFKRLKRQFDILTFDDLIDQVAKALTLDNGLSLVDILRRQYTVALVDEFQDTDSRQWSIFKNLYAHNSEPSTDHGDHALFLIGDPKQAIYGFRGGDVQTYLTASKHAQQAPPLTHNFRSRPSLIHVLNQLYNDSGDHVFHQSGINYQAVHPGHLRQDSDLIRHGEIAPAVTLWQAPPPENTQIKRYLIQESLDLCTHACSIAIYQWLKDSQHKQAHILSRPIQPQDIAVIVRNHDQAARIQHCLMQLGIPATMAGKQSLFQTREAREGFTLLLAVFHHTDDSRLRAALATDLVGLVAEQIDNLVSHDSALQYWHAQLLKWRTLVLTSGPYALFEYLCTQHVDRLLGLNDGERRISNYLQFGEHLQENYLSKASLQGLINWLEDLMTDASGKNPTHLLRLESDSACVQIMTFHKSKGLEFPLVFLPYIAIGRSSIYTHSYFLNHQASTVELHWKTLANDSEWKCLMDTFQREQAAEEARLLYVGLTRAIHALWLGTGPFHQQSKTAWSVLCQSELSPAVLAQATMVKHTFEYPQLPSDRLSLHRTDTFPLQRQLKRAPFTSWKIYSFTQLSSRFTSESVPIIDTDHDLDDPAITRLDETNHRLNITNTDTRLAGSRFGIVFHRAMELTKFSLWSDWEVGQAAPLSTQAELLRLIQDTGYHDYEWEEALGTLTQLVGNTLTTQLNFGSCLAKIPNEARRSEMEFHFPLSATSANRFLEILQSYGMLTQQTHLSAQASLEGMMTGVIDLVFFINHQWFILDYKTNELADYHTCALRSAMIANHYEFQALIYTIAVHRWIRFHYGDNYDYIRDQGGVFYLFCRGLNKNQTPSQGVYHWRFEPELIDEIDLLLSSV